MTYFQLQYVCIFKAGYVKYYINFLILYTTIRCQIRDDNLPSFVLVSAGKNIDADFTLIFI